MISLVNTKVTYIVLLYVLLYLVYPYVISLFLVVYLSFVRCITFHMQFFSAALAILLRVCLSMLYGVSLFLFSISPSCHRQFVSTRVVYSLTVHVAGNSSHVSCVYDIQARRLQEAEAKKQAKAARRR